MAGFFVEKVEKRNYHNFENGKAIKLIFAFSILKN
jgi:hypothetical protein